jgi:hypothetical protein
MSTFTHDFNKNFPWTYIERKTIKFKRKAVALILYDIFLKK